MAIMASEPPVGTNLGYEPERTAGYYDLCL